jgi:hypothetical protein
MRQPEDNQTLELPLTEKRGRGRPRKEKALTPAERARRYRERKAEQRDLFSRDASSTVTEKQIIAPPGFGSYFCEIHGWSCGNGAECFAQAKAELLELRKAIPLQNRDVTENDEPEDVDFWRGMYEAQLERTVELEQRIAASSGKGWTYAALTEAVESCITSHLARAEGETHDLHRRQMQNWAYGMYLFWLSLTFRSESRGDDARLQSLFELS